MFAICKVNFNGHANVVTAIECANLVRLRRATSTNNKSVKVVVGKISAISFAFLALKLAVVHKFTLCVVHCVLARQEGVQIVLMAVNGKVNANLIEQIRPSFLYLRVVFARVYKLDGDVASNQSVVVVLVGFCCKQLLQEQSLLFVILFKLCSTVVLPPIVIVIFAKVKRDTKYVGKRKPIIKALDIIEKEENLKEMSE